jgi:sugar phosphate isomerase/epimerase
MRLGGRVFGKHETPDAWAAAVRRLGYSAAYSPLRNETDETAINAYVEAGRAADIVIAEVGAWSNPMSADADVRNAAIEMCSARLALADAIGARCCVNVAGSRGKEWAGPDKDNLTDETFDMIVEVTRRIIDNVKPARTFFVLEPMPWMYPDSPDSYVRLLKAMDRKRFGVHLDVCNMVSSPRLYYGNADLIKECFAKLGPHIKSCHAKDLLLTGPVTVHIDEVLPGTGGMDYGVLLRSLSSLDTDTPLMIEHLKTAKEYDDAANYIRSVAKREGLEFT